jgi:hypothetical protein
MNLNKMVSSAIRILQKIRDASARATHLEAANKKYLLTTNERKQMSTKTNFKRIALVAVAALGLGVLSSVPSNAAISGNVTLTTSGSTSTTKLISDSTTAASATVKFLAGGNTDSVTISAVLKSFPSTATKPNLQAYFGDTTTSISPITSNLSFTSGDSKTVSTHSNGVVPASVVAVGAGYVSTTMLLALDSAVARVAGDYVWTVVATPYSNGAAGTAVTADVTLSVATLAAESTTAASTYSTSLISSQSGGTWAPTATDSVLASPATATGTAVAAVRVALKNAANGAAPGVKDSLTVTIDKGNVGTTHNAASGKSILVDYPAGSSYVDIFVYGDGSSGTGTISIATKNAGSFTETITWYATAYTSIVATSYRSVIAASTEGTKGAVKVNAYDVNSNSYGAATTVYAYSSDTSVISNYGTLCTWNTTDLVAYCALTGVKAGTANITFRDAATVAASTVVSNAVAVRVSTGVATSFTLTTDKASYAPGEKGYLIVTVKDAAGLVMPILSSATVLASGGITTTAQLGNSSDTTSATTFSTDRSSTPSSTDPIKVYTFYAPASAGTVTFSAKGASTFSAASQATASTASITVADSASAALAAVTALAVTVASLKTLITTLTNLVLKIQKKVKA